MNYLVAAYAVFWLVALGLSYSMIARQRRLEAELEVLRQTLDIDEQE
jgi:CcmD family protein